MQRVLVFETIEKWLQGLKGKDSRLYLSVSILEEENRPEWAKDKQWSDCLYDLASKAKKVLIISQSKDNFVYDGIFRKADPVELCKTWVELERISNSLSDNETSRIKIESLGDKRGTEHMFRTLGIRMHPLSSAPRTDLRIKKQAR